ncbi:hypothetical protein [Polaromonas jejuensis]|uniref:hypothetical protein n=1 Tax=Polaromonas jejuensis TaxID=457502 RepID=UPI001C3F8EC6|nr:hypothetical protein [Polaromonas jejuensis]
MQQLHVAGLQDAAIHTSPQGGFDIKLIRVASQREDGNAPMCWIPLKSDPLGQASAQFNKHKLSAHRQ